VLKVEAILWKEATADAAHEALLTKDLGDKSGQVASHVVPEQLFS
jgi:hypothetical protein